MPRAFITGITGQDGSYLAELLLEKGYVVHGLVRRGEAKGGPWLKTLLQHPAIFDRRLFLHSGDLNDPTSVSRALLDCAPDEVYHLAGHTHVGKSFRDLEATCELTGMGTLRLLGL